MDTISSYTGYDIEAFKAKPEEERAEILEDVTEVIHVLLEDPESTKDQDALNFLLHEWSSSDFMSELSLISPGGKVVFSSSPDLVGFRGRSRSL